MSTFEKIDWNGFNDAKKAFLEGEYPMIDASDDWALSESDAGELSHWDKKDLAERSQFMKDAAGVSRISVEGAQNV